MQFLLSDELIHDIIFAMENQSADFLFDSQELKCCSLEELNKSEQYIDKNRYYEIRQWNSAMGFRVMEQFVSSLHNPIAREELKNVLLVIAKV
jgi:hypothetical protein